MANTYTQINIQLIFVVYTTQIGFWIWKPILLLYTDNIRFWSSENQFIVGINGRDNLLKKSFRTDVFKYIHGILKESGQFPLATNGYLDHVHTFFELNPKNSVAEIAQIVKSNTSKWINENNFIGNKFSWQPGNGGFSYSRSQRDKVIKYIQGQEKHHKKTTFKDEYLEFLTAFEIEYDEKYLFNWIDLD